MEHKITFNVIDTMFADIQKALVFLRDNQTLIKCTEKYDVCNDFDAVRDHVAELRRRFLEEKGKTNPGSWKLGRAPTLWGEVFKQEDPGCDAWMLNKKG